MTSRAEPSAAAHAERSAAGRRGGKVLVYGATGYTGTLIAEQCAQRRVPAVLAGRSEAPLRALAERVGFPYVTSAIDEASALDAAVRGRDDDVACVLHCAGPFSRTSRQVADACLRTGRHYLDITGEIAVFEALAARDAEARAQGVMLLPGVGFDVVPSDCLAAHVARRMPDAVKLRLCIGMFGGAPSHGTTMTFLDGELAGAVRKHDVIVVEATGQREHTFDFGDQKRLGVSMPWGDVATAWHSTKIPDIEVYFSLPPAQRRLVKLSRFAGPIMRSKRVRQLLQSFVPAGGPDAAARARGKSIIVAEAEDASGRVLSSRLTTPEGYTVTADTAILCALRVLDGQAPVGFQTPSMAYGADLILEAAGSSRVDVP